MKTKKIIESLINSGSTNRTTAITALIGGLAAGVYYLELKREKRCDKKFAMQSAAYLINRKQMNVQSQFLIQEINIQENSRSLTLKTSFAKHILNKV